MKGVFALFRKKWVIQLIGITALCLSIWFFGDLVAIAGTVPLQSEMARLVTILLIVFLWGLNNIRVRMVATRNNQELLNDLAERPEEPTFVPDASNEEIGILSKDFDEALSILKKSQAVGQHNKQYIYELPWYIIIGPPGSGKTTALINSGLKFPLSNRFGDSSIRGVGGTRNCDWWFTEDAVLLDTAGRYTTQDSHQAVDQAAWHGFLDLLKKHRPRRPINGVMVTMSVSDLLHQSEEERNQHARAIRQRIRELNDILGIRFPIYMLFTKCDLIAGFTEFFDDLDHEGRAQVWGETFAEESQQGDEDFLKLYFDHFDGLIERLNDRQLTRIQDERDMQRRNRIFIFPQQVALLRDFMQRFLEAVFATTRYESPLLLRGIYFTSGTQEGTPIDRLMGMMADQFRFDRQKLPVYSGQGRGYFINRLLKDVVFQEAGLTGVNRSVENRRLWLQRVSYASALGLTAAIIALWSISFANNRGAITDLEKAIKDYRVTVAAKPDWEADLKNLLPRMNAVDQAREVFPEDPPMLMSFGIYQGHKLYPEAQRAYRRLLDGALTPLIKRRLEERIQRGSSLDPDVVYQLLRVYLMIGQTDRFQADIVAPWIQNDWRKTYANEVTVIAELDNHLDAWVKLPPTSQNLNHDLIKRTRGSLTKIPVANQVYARIKSDAQSRSDFDFVALRTMGRFGDRVFDSRRGQLNQLTIPGLYTAQGFHKIFVLESLKLAQEQIEQDWVLGNENRPSPEEVARLQKDLQRLYFRDYIGQWESLLNNLVIKKFNNVTHALDVLEFASDVDSPLRRLLAAVDINTSLTKTPGNAAAILAKVKTNSSLTGRVKKLLDLEQENEDKAQIVNSPGMEVERHFKRLNAQSQGETPLIDRTLASIGELHGFMTEVGSLSGGEAALKTAKARLVGSGGDIVGRVRLNSNRAPEPMKRWLRSFSSNSWAVVLKGARHKLNEIWRADVLPDYEAGLENRYPLFRDSQSEATLDDFGHFFSSNGVVDRFFKTHLKPFIDTSQHAWRNKQLEQQSIGISPSALKQFQYADKIRKVYFRNGGTTPSVNFKLKPIYLDADIAKFTLVMDGKPNIYRHGPPLSRSFQWPSADGAGRVRLIFESLNGELSSQLREGPWAWFRTLDEATTENTNVADRFRIAFVVDNHKVRYELEATSVVNPFRLAELERFRCPRNL